MGKRLIIGLLIVILPIIVFAQGAGGQVRRPVKKQQTTNTTPAKKRTSQQQVMSEKKRKTIIQNLINNMVYVEGGTFTMGATSEQGDEAKSNEKPTHKVTLSSFLIGKYEVTQEEWQAVMGDNPSHCKGQKRPVDTVCWDDCQEFIKKLNSLSGKQFRLPTEAEWEYAARGGNKSHGYKYSGSDNLDIIAWYGVNSGKKTHDVGKKKPNELGLYDMSGNVREWCQDRYYEYGSDSLTNPIVEYSGSRLVYRVMRGGSHCSGEWRVSYRYYSYNTFRILDAGFRLAL